VPFVGSTCARNTCRAGAENAYPLEGRGVHSLAQRSVNGFTLGGCFRSPIASVSCLWPRVATSTAPVQNGLLCVELGRLSIRSTQTQPRGHRMGFAGACKGLPRVGAASRFSARSGSRSVNGRGSALCSSALVFLMPLMVRSVRSVPVQSDWNTAPCAPDGAGRMLWCGYSRPGGTGGFAPCVQGLRPRRAVHSRSCSRHRVSRDWLRKPFE
jgi:hypothetical protein